MSAASPGVAQTRLVIGNWKAGCETRAAASALAEALVEALPPLPGLQVAVCPPFPHLPAVAEALTGGGPALGAQDLFWEDRGAYTGEVTGPMLADLGCSLALVGHSERRRLCGETDETASRKIAACRRAGLLPVLCVGETLQQRQAGATAEVLRRQVEQGLAGVGPGPLAIAYEPVWAIGTGQAATPADCADGLGRIRAALQGLFPRGPTVPLLYGGSVTAENCAAFWTDGGADGALVGGASLQAGAFAAICRQAAPGGGSRA